MSSLHCFDEERPSTYPTSQHLLAPTSSALHRCVSVPVAGGVVALRVTDLLRVLMLKKSNDENVEVRRESK